MAPRCRERSLGSTDCGDHCTRRPSGGVFPTDVRRRCARWHIVVDHMTIGTTDVAMDVGRCAPFGTQVRRRYLMALQAYFCLFGRRSGFSRDRHAIGRTQAENGCLATAAALEVLAGSAVALFTALLTVHIRAERRYERLMTDHTLSVQVGEFRCRQRPGPGPSSFLATSVSTTACLRPSWRASWDVGRHPNSASGQP